MFVGSKSLGVSLTEVDTTAKHVLGTRVCTDDGSAFVYVLADGTGIALRQCVKLTAGYVVAAAGSGFIYGVAPVAIGASKYGWVQVSGVVTAQVATSLSANVLLGLLSASSKAAAVVAVAEGGSTAHTAGAQTVRGVSLTAEASGVASIFLFSL